ncbi:MAG: proline--tRNA ligase [Thaumarchaeota archaeon]|nr:MAG: proline--tRNA ligase [Nitrososphaerota archaeon]
MAEAKQEGITVRKSENFDEWYTQVILKSELADYSPVSGCIVFRPSGYAIWEAIQRETDKEFKKIGIQNTYFPIFIPERLLKKEQEHVKGFSPEVAWVTQAGDSKLEERLAIRPTSETLMYEVISRWVRSSRDLPLRLNQWNNVVRWEFRHPTPLLRSREFLWNEGHTVFATEGEAMAERDEILRIYKTITEEYLALPGLVGKKTDAEKFAGATASYSIEHLMPDGKAIQGPDFHSDGQNFAKAFEISFVDRNGQKQFAWQNTWAISTREIGVMLAIHSDDKGLIVPPRVALFQVVIVPIFDEEARERVLKQAEKLRARLEETTSVKLDDRDHLTPGRKFNEWELKGVPLRVEIGARDLAKRQVVLARRDNGKKRQVTMASAAREVARELKEIQENLYQRALSFLKEHTYTAETYEQLKSSLKNGGIVRAPWCLSPDCEAKVKEETGAKIVNLPMDQKGTKSRCVYCGREAGVIANFAKSY